MPLGDGLTLSGIELCVRSWRVWYVLMCLKSFLVIFAFFLHFCFLSNNLDRYFYMLQSL